MNDIDNVDIKDLQEWFEDLIQEFGYTIGTIGRIVDDKNFSDSEKLSRIKQFIEDVDKEMSGEGEDE